MAKRYTKTQAKRELARATAAALDEEIRTLSEKARSAKTAKERLKVTEQLVRAKEERGKIRQRRRSRS